MITFAPDISDYDGRRWHWKEGWKYDLAFDWQKAKDGGVSMAIIKSSEGTFQARAFRMNWQGAQGILPRAAYHFFRCNISATQQAAYHLAVVNSAGYDPASDYFILDFETRDGRDNLTILRALGTYLNEMVRAGITPLIYTYPSFWRGAGGEDAAWVSHFPLALAQWPYTMRYDSYSLQIRKTQIINGAIRPMNLRPWTGLPAIWQFTSNVNPRAVPGFPSASGKKAVDYNAIYMPLPGAGTTPPEPPHPPAGDAGIYECNTGNLWIFFGPDSSTKIKDKLVRGQRVGVDQIVTNLGERWAHIYNIGGWSRVGDGLGKEYLVKVSV